MTVRFSRLTKRAQRALSLSQNEADKRRHREIDSQHLLVALLESQEILTLTGVERAGVGADAVRTEIDRVTPPANWMWFSKIPRSPDLDRLIVNAFGIADELNHHDVGVLHLLYGLLQQADGMAVQILQRLNVDVPTLASKVRSRLESLTDQ